MRLKRFGDGAEPHHGVIGAAVRLAPHIGKREAQIDEVMIGERQWRVVERLQDCAGNLVRFLVATLA